MSNTNKSFVHLASIALPALLLLIPGCGGTNRQSNGDCPPGCSQCVTGKGCIDCTAGLPVCKFRPPRCDCFLDAVPPLIQWAGR